MKRLFLFQFICLLIFQLNTAKSMDVSVTTASFYNGKESYLEVYLHVVGNTVSFDTLASGQIQASVHFLITLVKDGVIINYDKYTLSSPAMSQIEDFIDLRRFALPYGDYELKLEAIDQNNSSNQFSFEKMLSIAYKPAKIQLSDIQLLASFSKENKNGLFIKNGYFLEPAPFHFFPSKIKNLGFYIEVYNPWKDAHKAAYLSYTIYGSESPEDNNIRIQKFKKLDSLAIQPMILQLPISQLTSGNYQLLVEIRNAEKLLIDAKSIDFQRSNPELDFQKGKMPDGAFRGSFVHALSDEQVRYSLKALPPICKGVQSSVLNSVMMSKDQDAKRYFIWNYFLGINRDNPALAYEEFMGVADAVDLTYRSNVGYGFETDRGIIFLRYGKPSEIVEIEDEPSAPPYEIWFYNELEETRQYNIKFIFYNPSLANNDFILLHSNCKGERYNPRWEVDLYRNAPNEQEGSSAASTEMKSNYRRNARRIWEEL